MPNFLPFPTIRGRAYGASATGSQRKGMPKVLTAGFGGNYSQRTGDGPNFMQKPHVYRSPKLLMAEIKLLDDFLTARGGKEPFVFLVPGETVARQFTCENWTTDYTDQLHSTLVGNFDANFDP